GSTNPSRIAVAICHARAGDTPGSHAISAERRARGFVRSAQAFWQTSASRTRAFSSANSTMRWRSSRVEARRTQNGFRCKDVSNLSGAAESVIGWREIDLASWSVMAHQCPVRFLVALLPASDLLLCAKHLLFVAIV